MMNFQNTYFELPEQFHKNFTAPSFSPELIVYNYELAAFLKIDLEDKEELAKILSAQKILPTSKPIAMAYAGHQFGHFVPSLGDGRAVLLGELEATNKKLYDLHLKGAGQTLYSRGGDGLSPLGPAIREYLISEAMFHLNIKTTRSLAVVTTGKTVYREEAYPGAITARIASSHIRVGTFEYFAARQDTESLKILMEFTKKRLYPDCSTYQEIFATFIERQAELIASWLSIGFIHGVMNTDNTSIAGETIDYGPCAFMDDFQKDQCFSYIDRNKRYAYNNQMDIMMWNISRLATCLIPILDQDEKKSIAFLEQALDSMPGIFQKAYLNKMGKKFGLKKATSEHLQLIEQYLNHLEENKLDFTNSFRELSNALESEDLLPKEIYQNWKKVIDEQALPLEEVKNLMQKNNPFIIPRNHQVQKAIDLAYEGDFEYFFKLCDAFKNCYKESEEKQYLTAPPKISEIVKNTFCGT